MEKIQIVTDACSDIPAEWKDKHGIIVAPLSLIWDGKEVPATTDWESYTPKEFYDAVRGGASIKSNQVCASVFEDIFNKCADEGRAAIYVGCSSALSGSFSVGATVAEKIKRERPECEIYCIDAKIAAGGEAMLAVKAAEWAESGLSAEEVAARTGELSLHAYQVGSVDTLTYLKRAGRVKAAAAFFGNMLGIKPIIVNDKDGANIAVKKVKGRKNAIDTCIAMLKDVMCYDGQTYPVAEQTVYIGHADCIEDAEAIKARIMAEIGPKDVVVNYIGPCIGASVGPTMFGLYAFGKTAAER